MNEGFDEHRTDQSPRRAPKQHETAGVDISTIDTTLGGKAFLEAEDEIERVGLHARRVHIRRAPLLLGEPVGEVLQNGSSEQLGALLHHVEMAE